MQSVGMDEKDLQRVRNELEKEGLKDFASLGSHEPHESNGGDLARLLEELGGKQATEPQDPEYVTPYGLPEHDLQRLREEVGYQEVSDPFEVPHTRRPLMQPFKPPIEEPEEEPEPQQDVPFQVPPPYRGSRPIIQYIPHQIPSFPLIIPDEETGRKLRESIYDNIIDPRFIILNINKIESKLYYKENNLEYFIKKIR